MCLGILSSQPANVRFSVRCRGLQSFEKMLAFSRELVGFIGKLSRIAQLCGFFYPFVRSANRPFTSRARAFGSTSTWLPILPAET